MSRRIAVFGSISLIILASCGASDSGSSDTSFKSGTDFSSVTPPVDPVSGGHDGPIGAIIDEPGTYPEYNAQGASQLWSVHPDGTDLRKLTENVGVDSYDPRLSPDGSRVSYVAYDYDSDVPTRPGIWVMDVDGSNSRQLPLGELSLVWSTVSWDPTGSMVYFSGRDETTSGIWAINVRTGALTRVPVEMDDLSPPAWSPDGKRFAFVDTVDSADGDWSYWDLWIADADGDNLTRVTNGEFDSITSPEWLSDGSGIVFQSFTSGMVPRGGSNLWRVDLDSGRIVRIAGSQQLNDSWRVSPDGKYIAYQSFEGPCQVLVVSLEGSDESCAISNSILMNFAWSPDSTRLVFYVDGFSPSPVLDPSGEMNLPEPGLALWTVAVDGSDARQVTQSSPQSMGMGYGGVGYPGLVWRDTPNGELIIFSLND